MPISRETYYSGVARIVNQLRDANKALCDISSAGDETGTGGAPQIEGLNLTPLCDNVTGSLVGYVSVIYDEETQTTEVVFLDTNFQQLTAQPEDSVSCSSTAEGGPSDAIVNITLYCDDTTGDPVALVLLVIDFITGTLTELIYDPVNYDPLPVIPPNSSPCADQSIEPIPFQPTTGFTSGITTLFIIGDSLPVTYGALFQIRDIEIIVDSNVELRIEYTKSDLSVIPRTTLGAGVYSFKSELNEAPITSVLITNLSNTSTNLVVNALSKRS